MAAAPDPQDELYPIAVLMDELKVCFRPRCCLPSPVSQPPVTAEAAPREPVSSAEMRRTCF